VYVRNKKWPNQSSASKTCYQHVVSPTTVTIDIAISLNPSPLMIQTSILKCF